MTIRRDIPFAALRESDRQETGEFYLVFLTMWTKALADPIRVVSDPEDFVLDGAPFQGFQFDIKLLTDSDQMPTAQLTIQNVDRRIGEAILATVDPLRLNIEVIDGAEFDISVFPRVEVSNPSPRVYSAKYLYLTEVKGDDLQIQANIRSWDYVQETWPAMRGTQGRFPGLYWS